MPLPSLPGRRRTKPAPFSRASIDISHHGRTWVENYPVYELKVGDTVAGHGLIDKVTPYNFPDIGVVVEFPHNTVDWEADQVVRAFVKRED